LTVFIFFYDKGNAVIQATENCRLIFTTPDLLYLSSGI